MTAIISYIHKVGIPELQVLLDSIGEVASPKARNTEAAAEGTAQRVKSWLTRDQLCGQGATKDDECQHSHCFDQDEQEVVLQPTPLIQGHRLRKKLGRASDRTP